MAYLNLGCGNRFHTDWQNIDFKSTGAGVIAHNLIEGIPFPDSSFDVVYHSHLLEHFTKPQAQAFIQECTRVLRPQGILRIVVPDLEKIAKLYLQAVELSLAGDETWKANYEWMLLEMFDQTVRNVSGGEMAAYLSQAKIPNQDFILARLGIEARNLLSSTQQVRTGQALSKSVSMNFLKEIYRFFRNPIIRREILFKLLLGGEYSALQIGRFRQKGEIHQWMYDRYSLSALLYKCRLTNVVQRSAHDSYLPDWQQFSLDAEPDGTLYKPDSLYMEALKLDK
ncbi:MAG: methyltransferase domain-containing protein [Caldilinea sp. CFX5]|nr:methyltransferase domain-containing protein [Caldilinea sp. CFX5]